jgi:phosphohistidine swiveling domain-containing protein
MKYVKGLAKRKLNSWIGKKWYHQRFDGAPYFMHFIAEGEIENNKERKLGGHFTVHYCFYDEGKADWYILMDDIKQVYTSIIKESKKIKDIGKYFIDLWQKDQDLFYKKCLEVGKTDLSRLSDKGLIKMQDDFVEITLNKNSSSSLIDGFALGTDEMIADMIKKAYENSKLKEKMRFTEVFSVLTAPVHLSFINEAEVNLLNVALGKKGIKQHQKDFFWIKNNYVDSYVLTENDFRKDIEKLKSMDIDIKDELKKIEETPKRNKENKIRLMKEIKLDDELKTLIKISEDFTYWQDERKKSTLWTTHYFSLILQEISKRVRIPLDEIKYMTPREVSNIFKKIPEIKELQERKKNGVFYWDIEGHEALYGKDADEVKNKILGSTDLSDVNDFRGLTASMGKAVGKVKIVKSAKEIDKIEKGDILIAVMTRPDYVPAMKKAAAIVTDEGGITSHAAIVSRELGIPCIIGTKIATKVLKDGMLVEVNANHGWVKIIDH